MKVALGRLWWFRTVRCSLAYLFPSVTLAEDKLLFLHSRSALCVIYYYYLQWEMCSVTQSYPTLWGPMGGSLPASSAHGIFQGRVLEWGAILCPKESSQSRDGTCVSCVSCIGRQILYHYNHLGSSHFRGKRLKINPLGRTSTLEWFHGKYSHEKRDFLLDRKKRAKRVNWWFHNREKTRENSLMWCCFGT